MDSDESSSKLCYKLRSEKTLSGEVIAVQWSPKMDLIAFALKDGCVTLNRLSWQRVWTTTPTHSSVTTISWRPDGRVLAVGHDDGTVALREVENARVLHKFSIGVEIIYLSWTTCPCNSSSYKDESALFTCPLQPMDESKETDYTVEPSHLIDVNGASNILTLGDVSGRVYLYMLGLFHMVTVDLHSQTEKILWSMLSTDLHYLSVVSANDDKLKYYSVTIPLLKPRVSELNFIAVKFGFISCLIKHISAALNNITEAWEDALLLMDAKLADYAQSLPKDTTLADEMIMLLACGKARTELKEFLIEELTEKGIQKLGQSIKMSYATIKKIIASQVTNAISSLLYHLSELLGMSRWYDKFGVLGLSASNVEACIVALSSFALKTHELLLVIENSMKSGKIFFEWLILVIRKLSGEVIPPTHRQCPDATELGLLMDFLKKRLTASGSDNSEGKRQRFNMEIVAQYFDDQDLQCVMQTPPTMWNDIIKDAGLYNTDNSLCFTDPQPSKSLTQLFNCLHKEIDQLFSITNESLSSSVDLNFSCDLTTCTDVDDKKAQALIGGFSKDSRCYLYFPTPLYMGFVELFLSNKECGITKQFHFVTSSDTPERLNREVLSIQNYDSTSLSVLFMDGKNTSSVGQLPINCLTQLADDSNTITSLADNLMEVENLTTFPGDMLAVTGSRRLVSVIAKSVKKIRLYDVDDE